MAKQRSNIIGVLDIGSSKVVCFIAKIAANGRIEVLGIGQHLTNGFKAGIITNIKSLEKSIAVAVESAEKMAEEAIQKVYVSISPNITISSITSSNELIVTGHEINQKDEKKLLFEVLDRYVTERKLEVIHSFAQDYKLDGQGGISSPIGMFGNKLSCDYHVVAVPPNYTGNLYSCLSRCQLRVEHPILSSYAAGMACLTSDERTLGTTFIEIGGGCTSVSVFYKGHMIFTDAIGFGGTNITSDIAQGLSTDLATAERIKNLYGALKLDIGEGKEKIEVPISQHDTESHVFNRSLLVEIIAARMEEILEIVREKLITNHIANKYSGNKIVITGGGAQLNGVKDMVNQIFNKNSRIGYPTSISGIAESTSGTPFSAVVGMLLYASEVEHMHFTKHSKPDSLLNGIVGWFKENFLS